MQTQTAGGQKLTPRQYLKRNPQEYVMVTHEFGYPLYVSPGKGLSDPPIITDRQDEADTWSAMDNTPTKLGYYKSITGYVGLVFELI